MIKFIVAPGHGYTFRPLRDAQEAGIPVPAQLTNYRKLFDAKSVPPGIWAFCDNPDQYQLLVNDPSLAHSATEEIVRWASPVMYFRRNVTHDTELRGHEIKAGDKVSIWYASANRDEEVFADPFRFDIERDPNDHVAFGGGGPHFCLGASLARMEIRVLFEELATRVPRLEPLGAPDRLRSNFIGGIKHLPVGLRT